MLNTNQRIEDRVKKEWGYVNELLGLQQISQGAQGNRFLNSLKNNHSFLPESHHSGRKVLPIYCNFWHNIL